MLEHDALKSVRMSDLPHFKEHGKRYVSFFIYFTEDCDHFLSQRHEKGENLRKGWVNDYLQVKHPAQYQMIMN